MGVYHSESCDFGRSRQVLPFPLLKTIALRFLRQRLRAAWILALVQKTLFST